MGFAIAAMILKKRLRKQNNINGKSLSGEKDFFLLSKWTGEGIKFVHFGIPFNRKLVLGDVKWSLLLKLYSRH